MRAVLLCPGRGSYGRAQLGTLPADPSIHWLDAYRQALGRPTLTELDQADRFRATTHLAGEHASLLTFGATVADAAAVDRSVVDVVAVTGNSMGWYTALHVGGALALPEAARLVETMGAYQRGNVQGGQVLYPTSTPDWRPSADLQRVVADAVEQPGVFLSIDLGGTAVLGGTSEGVAWLLANLPKVERGARVFPMQLPLHSAFHTPLLQSTSDRAAEELADLQVQPPAHPLVAGDGSIFRRWSHPGDILDYTLTTQVTDPYDLRNAVEVAMGSYAPDSIICLGPGDSMGASVASTLIAMGWRGLRDRADFMEAQGGAVPLVISMAREAQRRLVAA